MAVPSGENCAARISQIAAPQVPLGGLGRALSVRQVSIWAPHAPTWTLRNTCCRVMVRLFGGMSGKDGLTLFQNVPSRFDVRCKKQLQLQDKFYFPSPRHPIAAVVSPDPGTQKSRAHAVAVVGKPKHSLISSRAGLRDGPRRANNQTESCLKRRALIVSTTIFIATRTGTD